MSTDISNPSKPVRVCLVQSNPVWGACEEHLALLAERLDPERFSVTLIHPDSPALGTGFGRLPGRVIRRTLDAASFGSILRGHFRLAALLREVDPQVVHCNDPGLAAMAAAQRLMRAKKVLMFHTPSQPFGYRPRAAWLHRRLIRSGWDVVVSSESNRATARRLYGISAGRLHTIACGIDPEPWEAAGAGRAREERRSSWGVPGDETVLLCAARLEPQKNHELLFAAYAALSREVRRRTRLVLVGAGSLEVRLRELCGRLGIGDTVVFAGHQNRMPEAFAAADVHVLASHYEGMPFAILEAMACGLPVIATAVDGNRDAVEDGRTGLLTPPGSAEALTEALLRMIESPDRRARMGAAGRARFHERFTAERMVGRLQALYAGEVR